ncbi:MAG: MBL fold metallo-hydrolase [Clostridia bacterium]|nr:MBL fold metallo-hydrolase [Clostridia bacterium]MBQ2518355.1 MBL fold metallo-hydrolase [Clostridia bacterium]MBQ4341960.1 MBL fold metallo-hydrolase [Clostridia bacterium]
MNIKWYGQSCFLLTDENGVRILTDPCGPGTGYSLQNIECDGLTVSHGHFDHNYIEAACGSPLIMTEPGSYCVNGVKITGFAAFHDNEGGAKRGANTMFLFEMDGMRILHAGDIGHQLSKEQLAEIGVVDVLLVPIGGTYTLNYLEAREFANSLRPSVVIPMHFRTPVCALSELDDCQNFVSTVQDCRIHKLNDCEASIYRNTLGEDRVLVLDPCIEKDGAEQVSFDI